MRQQLCGTVRSSITAALDAAGTTHSEHARRADSSIVVQYSIAAGAIHRAAPAARALSQSRRRRPAQPALTAQHRRDILNTWPPSPCILLTTPSTAHQPAAQGYATEEACCGKAYAQFGFYECTPPAPPPSVPVAAKSKGLLLGGKISSPPPKISSPPPKISSPAPKITGRCWAGRLMGN
jgi:hypothetical protein